MDFNVNTEIKQSKINGLYQEVEAMKRDRAALKERIDTNTAEIIQHIVKNGNVIAYKDNTPYVLTVKDTVSKKLDKDQLAIDLDVSKSYIDLFGVAQLVEEGKLTAEKLKTYEYEEPTQKLSARKAKKSDMELIFGGKR
jgi:hypothetical protein